MKTQKFMTCALLRFLACSIALGLTGSASPAVATTANVSIINFAFSPATVTINVNDQVTWSWAAADGSTPHSTTSTNGLWDSGLHGQPFTFSHTFANAGSFPYRCTLHSAFMTGSVTVQGANIPPSVALTSPSNGAKFAAPWTGPVQASVSDPDDAISKVEFFIGTTSVGVVNNPGASPSITVTNLAAGSYTLKAVATDSRGAATTSAGVPIQVLQPVPILLSSPQRVSDSSFQFSYSATPGLRYVIQRSRDLVSFTALATNTAATSSESFLDGSAVDALSYYSIRLQPNP
jgi:plastocyanin